MCQPLDSSGLQKEGEAIEKVSSEPRVRDRAHPREEKEGSSEDEMEFREIQGMDRDAWSTAQKTRSGRWAVKGGRCCVVLARRRSGGDVDERLSEDCRRESKGRTAAWTAVNSNPSNSTMQWVTGLFQGGSGRPLGPNVLLGAL